MFTLMAGRTSLGVHPDAVVAIIESINNPNVSVPGYQTEPTKAFIVGARTSQQGFTAYIYMHLLDTNSVAIFAPDSSEVPLDQYPHLEAEAIHFVESMGFMLDNMNFRARSADEQARLAATLPVFLDRPRPPERSASMQMQSHGSGPYMAVPPGTGPNQIIGQVPQTGSVMGQMPGTGAGHLNPPVVGHQPTPGQGMPLGFGTPAQGVPAVPAYNQQMAPAPVPRPPTGSTLTPHQLDALARLLASF